MTTYAHVAWTGTSLGAGYGATWVQRQDPVTLGWWDIAMSTVETSVFFNDFEARRNAAEPYRVLVESNLGVRSVAASAVSVTVTGLGDCTFELASNEDPTINQAFNISSGIGVSQPENVATGANSGRDGQRLYRSFEKMGEDWGLSINLLAGLGPDLWRTLTAALRKDLSYITVLSPWGHRWMAGFTPNKVKVNLLALTGSRQSSATLDAGMLDVATSPSVVGF